MYDTMRHDTMQYNTFNSLYEKLDLLTFANVANI